MKKVSCIVFPVIMILSVCVLSPLLLRKSSVVHASEASDTDTLPKESSPAPKVPSDPADTYEPEPVPESADRYESDAASEDSGTAAAETAAEAPLLSKEEFFSDALFIGDSRTVGLMEYAELNTADFFATSGMSTFQVLKKEVSVPGTGKLTLEELLEQKSYGKIYLMLGINELGYPADSVEKQFRHVAETVRALQPDARLFLCSNLHLTSKRSDTDAIYNNANIDRLNGQIASLADGQTSFYLDANPLFDDENGALTQEYSADDTHPYGKYYFQWGEWIYETCVSLTESEGTTHE